MRNEMLKSLSSAVLSGILISVGCIIYLSSANNVVGAFLFSFGLITIVLRGYLLYTGKIGYAYDVNVLKLIPLIILGNLIGTYILAAFVPYTSALVGASAKLIEPKLLKSFSQVMFDAVGCGAMMYLAVDGYRIKNNLLLLIFPVMIFILCGFEHSVADMFYFGCAKALFTWSGVKFIFLVIIGNAIGALFFSLLHKFIKD